MEVYKRTKIEVPDYNDSFVKFTTGGKQYQLRFTWNDTERRWMFGVYNALREPIMQGVKVVPHFPLNLFCGSGELYGGIFAVFTDLDTIGRQDFNNGNATFAYVAVE